MAKVVNFKVSLKNLGFAYNNCGHFGEISIGEYVTVLVNLSNNSPMVGIRKLPGETIQTVYVTGSRQNREARGYVNRWIDRHISGIPSRVFRQRTRNDISGLLTLQMELKA